MGLAPSGRRCFARISRGCEVPVPFFSQPRRRNIPVKMLRVFVFLYCAVVVAVWLLIRFLGDRWWLAALLTYGPRLIYLAPLALLVPLAGWLHPRSLAPLTACACIALFSLMGFNVPWRSWGGGGDPDLRLFSYNIERYNVPGEDFTALLNEFQPDLIAVQECAGVGSWKNWWEGHVDWHTVHRGELLVASRYPIKHFEVSYSRWPQNRTPVLNAIYCVVATPLGDIGFCNLHLDTPRRALSAVLDRQRILNLSRTRYADYRLQCRQFESSDLLEWLSGFPEPKIIAGDFNMMSDSSTFRSDWNRFHNAHDWAGWGFGHTKRTVIRRRHYGSRIDHLLSDENWTPVSVRVGPDLGSDHVPLMAGFAKAEK